MLQKVLRDAALGPGKAAGLKADLASGARDLRERVWEDFDSEFSTMSDLQKAILRRLVEQGPRFAPFAAPSLGYYSAAVGKHVTAAEAQAALDGLRHKNIVWRNARAAYALEDQDMADWFVARYGAGNSAPPT
jgi:hypothetical protein